MSFRRRASRRRNGLLNGCHDVTGTDARLWPMSLCSRPMPAESFGYAWEAMEYVYSAVAFCRKEIGLVDQRFRKSYAAEMLGAVQALFVKQYWTVLILLVAPRIFLMKGFNITHPSHSSCYNPLTDNFLLFRSLLCSSHPDPSHVHLLQVPPRNHPSPRLHSLHQGYIGVLIPCLLLLHGRIYGSHLRRWS